MSSVCQDLVTCLRVVHGLESSECLDCRSRVHNSDAGSGHSYHRLVKSPSGQRLYCGLVNTRCCGQLDYRPLLHRQITYPYYTARLPPLISQTHYLPLLHSQITSPYFTARLPPLPGDAVAGRDDGVGVQDAPPTQTGAHAHHHGPRELAGKGVHSCHDPHPQRRLSATWSQSTPPSEHCLSVCLSVCLSF